VDGGRVIDAAGMFVFPAAWIFTRTLLGRRLTSPGDDAGESAGGFQVCP